MKPKEATRFMSASAKRFGFNVSAIHKREESLVKLTPKPANLTRAFRQVIQPCSQVLSDSGQIGLLIVGCNAEQVTKALAQATAAKWKWTAFENGSLLVMPRGEELTEDHVKSVASAMGERVQVGFGAVLR